MAINQMLYNALKLAFPAGVKIAKEGQQMRYRIRKDFVTGNERIVIEDEHHGEEYRVCCPFCGDDRYRLWINHKWDTEDPVSKVQFGLGLASCFNDGCDMNKYADGKKGWQCRQDLRKLISPLLRHTVSTPYQIKQEEKIVVPELPEKLIPLSQLDRSHHARTYIESRGIDVDRLVELYQVAYCPEDQHPFVSDRIIIPVRQNSTLVGWQARYIGKPAKHIPKYFTMPGMRKTQVLYNYDRASQYPVGVIMEGVTDVWSVGGQGVNVFGASIGEQQRKLIHAAWGDTGIVLLSDADVTETDEKRAQYEKLRDSLLSLCRWGLLEVRLEDGDPGDMFAEDLWVKILRSAERVNYQHPIFDSTALQFSCHRRSYE